MAASEQSEEASPEHAATPAGSDAESAATEREAAVTERESADAERSVPEARTKERSAIAWMASVELPPDVAEPGGTVEGESFEWLWSLGFGLARGLAGLGLFPAVSTPEPDAEQEQQPAETEPESSTSPELAVSVEPEAEPFTPAEAPASIEPAPISELREQIAATEAGVDPEADATAEAERIQQAVAADQGELASVESALETVTAAPEEVASEASVEAEDVAAEGEGQASSEADAAAAEAELQADTEPEEPGELAALAAGISEGSKGADSGGGGGGNPELSAWQARISARTVAIPQPDLADVSGLGDEGRQRSTTITDRRAQAREGLDESAREAVPDAPQPNQPPPPIEDDPVPHAWTKIQAKTERRLSDQTLPTLTTSPLGFMPKLRGPPTRAAAAEATTVEEQETAPSEAEDTGGEERAGTESAEQARERVAAGPEAVEAEASGEPPTLTDEGPPPAPEFDEATRADMGQVVARLLESIDADADSILDRAKAAAFPNEALLIGLAAHPVPELIDDQRTELVEALDLELRGIAGAAEVSEQELEAAIAERSAERERLAQEAAEDIDAAGEEAVEALGDAAQEDADAIASARESADLEIEQQTEASLGEADPQVIEAKRDRILRRNQRMVGTWMANYRQAQETRTQALEQHKQSYVRAYRAAGEADVEELLADVEDRNAIPRDVADRVAASRGWASTQSVDTRRVFASMHSAVVSEAEAFRAELMRAGTAANQAIREWADQRLNRERSWWARLWDMISDWLGTAQESAERWEELRNEQSARELDSDLRFVRGLQTLDRSLIDLAALRESGQLSAEQLAIVEVFFGSGPDAGDPIAAVAAGTKVRIAGRRVPEIADRLRDRVMELSPSEGNFKLLEHLGASEGGGFNATSRSSQLYEAMHGGLTGWGTDEDSVYSALSNLTTVQLAAVKMHYRITYGRDLDADISAEFSGSELDRAQALAEGKSAEADVAALYHAMHGGLTGWGTDEQLIMDTLRGKSPEQREAIFRIYRERYGRDLSADFSSELSGTDWTQADALSRGDTATADAAALEGAFSGGWLFGAGTDEQAIEDVYARIRREVEGEAGTEWTSAEVEAEIRRRIGAVETAFGEHYGDRYEVQAGQSALRAAFESELSGPELDLANALADNDQLAADVARLRRERHGFITDDDAVNAVLENQFERAEREVTRDTRAQILRELREEAERSDPPLTEAQIQQRLDERMKESRSNIERDARRRSEGYMADIESGFDEAEGYGGALRLTLALHTSGEDRKRAFTLLDQGGYLTPVQRVDFAVDGAGTDEDALRELLRGKSAAEVEEIRRAWEAAHPGQSFDERIMSELSGRDAQDFRYLLQGEPPANDYAARLQRQLERAQWELDNYSAPWASAERQALELEVERLRHAQQRLEEQQRLPEDQRDPKISQFYEGVFSRRDEGVNTQIEAYRRGVDSGLDTITTAIGAVAAIVAAVVVGIFTAGTGTALIIGALAASLAGTAATMATKAIVLGGAYGWEDIGTDLAMGAVDAVVSVATAGLGDKLLRAGRLALMANRGGIAKIAAHGIANTAEALASAVPTALISTATSEAVLESHDSFGAFLSGFGTQVAMGTALDLGIQGGLAVGGAARRSLRGTAPPDLPPSHLDAQVDARAPATRDSGAAVAAESSGPPAPREQPPVRDLSEVDIAEPKPQPEHAGGPPLETPDTRRLAPPDDTGLPGTPEQRAALWNRFQAENPGASYGDFELELKSGKVAVDLDDAVARLQRDLRDQLLSGVPPHQRAQFADVEIRVLSDAEFKARTRSDAGNAVVEIVDGQPRIFMREGASPNVLREEGVHLAQLVDPRTRAKVLALDESVLRSWDQLPLDRQLELYRTKVELEIDAQRRLLAQLDEALAEAVDDATLRSLREQIDRARANLDNLGRRLDEVDATGPRERAEMLAGTRERPQWLDQPARLFQKTDKSVTGLVDDVLQVPGGRGELGKRRQRIIRAVDSLLAKGDQAFRQQMDAALRSLQSISDDVEIRSKALLQVLESANTMPPAQALALVRDFEAVPKSILDRATPANTTLRELVDSVADLSRAVSSLPSIKPDDARDLARAILRAGEGRQQNQVYVGAARLLRAAKEDSVAARMLEYRNHLEGPNADKHARTLAREGMDLDSTNPRLTEELQNSLRDSGHFGVLERRDWSTRLSDWTSAFTGTKVPTLPSPEQALHGLLRGMQIPAGQAALIWRWRGLLLDVTSGMSAQRRTKLIRELLDGTNLGREASSNELIRARLRKQALDLLVELPWPAQLQRLRTMLDLHPDAAHGAFFMEYRRRRLGYESPEGKLELEFPADPSKASTLDGVTAVNVKPDVGGGRSADGVVDVDPTQHPAVRPASGQSESGPVRMLVEEKAGRGAFKGEQAENYIRLLLANDGHIGTATDARGVIYIVDAIGSMSNAEPAIRGLRNAIESNPTITSAVAAVRAAPPNTPAQQQALAHLQQQLNKINIVVARYGDNGQLEFLPLPWRDPDYLRDLADL